MYPNLKNLKLLLANRIPPQLVIQMTNQCNARCPQCGMRVSNPSPRSTLSRDTMALILDAAAAKGVQALSFTGGEPFVNRELPVMIAESLERGFETLILTNAMQPMMTAARGPPFGRRRSRH